MYSMEVCVSTVSIIVGDDALGVPIFLTNWINGDYHNNVTPNNSTSKIPKPRRYLSERDAHFCETEIASLPHRCGGQVFRLPNRVVIVGLFLRRANGVRPYRFVAVGSCFSRLYSIFKLQTRCRKCFSVRSEPLIVFTLLTLTECFLIHCYLAGYSIWDNILILIPKITTFVA